MAAFLEATGRADIASYASRFAPLLRADEGAEYEEMVDIVRMIISATDHSQLIISGSLDD